jgi:hypothetical protein
MSRHEEGGRHRLPVPPEMRERQPFVFDARTMR